MCGGAGDVTQRGTNYDLTCEKAKKGVQSMVFISEMVIG